MARHEGSTGIAASTKYLTRLQFLYRCPGHIMAAVATCVFLSDTIIMIARTQSNLRDHITHHILDSVLLVAILFPVLFFLVFRPIKLHLAERGQAEENLANERNKLREILDAMPAGAYIVDRWYRLTYANMALVKELGPVHGRCCHEYFHGLPEPCSDCRIAEVLQGKSFTWETTNETNGKVYEVFETPVQNSDDTFSRLAMMRDITARKVAERELLASRQKLRSLSFHQQRTREKERAAVSREIHDELGQVLATVQLGVSSLGEHYHDHRILIDKIAGMEQLVAGAIKTVQRISTQLRPAILDELGLAEAVEWQAAEFRTRTGIACTPDILLQETSYNKDVATAVFRICQEALTNVIRHSGATRVALLLEERHSRIVLTVADNGRGISPEQLRDSQSLGITGMRERALALGGRMRICRWRHQGTVVIVHIPVDPTGGTA
jgi:signal transduction histidine kinase